MSYNIRQVMKMAKEKRVPKDKKDVIRMTEDSLNLLYGLCMMMVGLIGLTNQGIVGHFMTYCFVYTLGWLYFVVYLFLIVFGLILFIRRAPIAFHIRARGVGILLAFLSMLFLFALITPLPDLQLNNLTSNYYKYAFGKIVVGNLTVEVGECGICGSGLIGYFLVTLFNAFVSEIGTWIITFALLFAAIYLIFSHQILSFFRHLSKMKIKHKEAKEEKKKQKEEEKNEERPIQEAPSSRLPTEPPFRPVDVTPTSMNSSGPQRVSVTLPFSSDGATKKQEMKEPEEKKEEKSEEVLRQQYIEERKKEEQVTPIGELFAKDLEEPVSTPTTPVVEKKPLSSVEEKEVEVKKTVIPPSTTPTQVEVHQEEFLVEEKVVGVPTPPSITKEIKTSEEKKEEKPSKYVGFVKPSLDLLTNRTEQSRYEENEEISRRRLVEINEAFENMGKSARAISYTIGPSITRFDIEIGKNSTVNSLGNITEDLDRLLGGITTRFEKVVRNKTTSGLEVPNEYVDMVSLREVLEKLAREPKTKILSVPFGKDISGNIIFESITKFPHMLVAGTSGSGKSVFVHQIIMSIIMRQTPDDVRLLLVDTKQVEMNKYREIPHLLCPIVTSASEAKVALRKLVQEMNRRYTLLSDECVSSIDEYNEIMVEQGKRTVPYIVVVIDEFADIIMSCRDVETPVLSLSQKARAAGIHLIIATQRPTTQIVTGNLKANLNVRVALLCASSVDSQTILGSGGAESLAGNGDLLLSLPSKYKGGMLVRLQSPYVDSREIRSVTTFLRSNYETDYDPEYLDLKDHSFAGPSLPEEEDGSSSQDRYQTVKEAVMLRDFVSISYIQNTFNMGYPTAKDMFRRLQEEGIIEKNVEGNTNSRGTRVIKRRGSSEDDTETIGTEGGEEE